MKQRRTRFIEGADRASAVPPRSACFLGKPLDLWAAALVALAAAAVRLPPVYDRPFWEDEVFSARVLSEPSLWSMLHRVVQTESTPPLWYLIGWFVHQLGVPLRQERLLSVLFGALFAALVVLLARRLVRLPLAMLAGLLTAFGTEFVRHGHELRSYELFALVSVVFALALLAELEAPSRRRELLVAASAATGGLTHFFFAFVVAAALSWLWLEPAARAVRRRAAGAILAGGAAAALWLPLLVVQYQPARFWWIGSFRWRALLAVPLRLFTSAESGTVYGRALSATAVALLLAGCFRLARSGSTGRLTACLAVVPIAEAGLVWAAGMPIFDLRNLIGVGGFVAIAFAAVPDALPPRLAVAAAVPLSAAIAFATVTAASGTPPYDLIARALIRAGWNGSQPIAVYGDPDTYQLPLEWYLPHQPALAPVHPRHPTRSDVFLIEPHGAIRWARLPPHIARNVTLLVDRRARAA